MAEMAGMLSQLPLPWIPDGAAEVAPGVGLESFSDGGGAVWVHGLMTFCWADGDEAGRRLAAVQLAELKAATQQQVAGAFGIGVVTLWRWLDGYRRDGLAGLVAGKRGPRGPSKLTPELTQRIGELAAAGKSQAAIAAAAGVSTFAVRTALGRIDQDRRIIAVKQRIGEIDPANAKIHHFDAGWKRALCQTPRDLHAEGVVTLEDITDTGDEDLAHVPLSSPAGSISSGEKKKRWPGIRSRPNSRPGSASSTTAT